MPLGAAVLIPLLSAESELQLSLFFYSFLCSILIYRLYLFLRGPSSSALLPPFYYLLALIVLGLTLILGPILLESLSLVLISVGTLCAFYSFNFDFCREEAEEGLEVLTAEIGRGLAFNYWQGFLKFVVGDNADQRIRRFMEEYELNHPRRRFPIKKMLLLIPKNCDFPDNLNWRDHGMERVTEIDDFPVPQRRHSKMRPKKVNVAKLFIGNDIDPWYIAFDFPNTLKSSMGPQKRDISESHRSRNVETFLDCLEGLLEKEDPRERCYTEFIEYSPQSDKKLCEVLTDKIRNLNEQTRTRLS